MKNAQPRNGLPSPEPDSGGSTNSEGAVYIYEEVDGELMIRPARFPASLEISRPRPPASPQKTSSKPTS